jgi:hypothetical protein
MLFYNSRFEFIGNEPCTNRPGPHSGIQFVVELSEYGPWICSQTECYRSWAYSRNECILTKYLQSNWVQVRRLSNCTLKTEVPRVLATHAASDRTPRCTLEVTQEAASALEASAPRTSLIMHTWSDEPTPEVPNQHLERQHTNTSKCSHPQHTQHVNATLQPLECRGFMCWRQDNVHEPAEDLRVRILTTNLRSNWGHLIDHESAVKLSAHWPQICSHWVHIDNESAVQANAYRQIMWVSAAETMGDMNKGYNSNCFYLWFTQ